MHDISSIGTESSFGWRLQNFINSVQSALYVECLSFVVQPLFLFIIILCLYSLLIQGSENRIIFEGNELVHNFLDTMFEEIPKVGIVSWRLHFEFSRLFLTRGFMLDCAREDIDLDKLQGFRKWRFCC